MTSTSETPASQPQSTKERSPTAAEKTEKVLCPHCLRTASNGIKCKGICVADSDY